MYTSARADTNINIKEKNNGKKEKMMVVTREQMEEFKKIACDKHIQRLKKMFAEKGQESDPIICYMLFSYK